MVLASTIIARRNGVSHLPQGFFFVFSKRKACSTPGRPIRSYSSSPKLFCPSLRGEDNMKDDEGRGQNNNAFGSKWQGIYDDIMDTNAARYPLIVQRLHAESLLVRAQRESEGADQSKLGAHMKSVLTHKRVLYVMVAHESVVLCSTRQTAAEDMLEITTRQLGFGSKRSSLGRWLREAGDQHFYCYLLESLHSTKFHETEPKRRRWWERRIRELK